MLQDQKKYNQAEKMHQRAIEGRRKTLGEEHPDTLHSIHCLAVLYSAMGLDETPLNPVADIQANSVPTDSGYESMAHKKSIPVLDTSQSETDILAEILSLSDVNPAVKIEHSVNQEQAIPKFGLYTAPTAYSASETSTLPLPRNEEYISQLALDLFNSIKSYESDRNTLERISDKLPDLLRAFALKIGHKAQSQMHRDISFFVYKHRK